MGNPSAAHEPSMEEILASIRQIISEDGEQAEGEAQSPESRAAGAAERGEPEPAVAAADAATEGAGEAAVGGPEPSGEETPPSAAAAAPRPPEASQQQRTEPTLRRQPVPQQPAAAVAPQPAGEAMAGAGLPAAAAPARDDGRLLSPQADATVSGAFSALAHTILAQNARTLEDLVSEMLRPMLKEWLDDNLPPLVERLVKEEIERVSRGRR